MPELPSSTRRVKFIRAASRMGFHINKGFGKGDHYMMFSPDKRDKITVPKSFETHRVRQSLAKFIQKYGDLKKFLKEL